MSSLGSLTDVVAHTPGLKALKAALADNQSPILAAPAFGAGVALLLRECHLMQPERVLFAVAMNSREAARLVQDLRQLMARPDDVVWYPDWDLFPYDRLPPVREVMMERVAVMHRLAVQDAKIVVLPAGALMRRVMAPSTFQDLSVSVAPDMAYDPKDLSAELVRLGYQRVEKVTEPGEFSWRGSILDVFPGTLDDPLRLDYFDDVIETIKVFDAESQVSRGTTDSALILPTREVVLTDDAILQAIDTLESRFGSGYSDKTEWVEGLMAHHPPAGYEQSLPLFFDTGFITDYAGAAAQLVLIDPQAVRQQIEKTFADAKRRHSESFRAKHVRLQPTELFAQWSDIEEWDVARLDISSQVPDRDDVVVLDFQLPHVYRGDFQEVSRDFQAILQNGGRIVIGCSSEPQRRRLEAVFEEDQSHSHGKLSYVDCDLSTGMAWPGFVFIQDREIFGKKKTLVKSLRNVRSAPIDSFLDLSEGDLIVHINHGVGRFLRIERKTVLEKTKDFILIEYADAETLYVPVEQMNLVQRYIGGDSRLARLDKLGSKSWERRKARARERAEKLAKDLIAIYASRQAMQGYAFQPDTAYQIEMEAQFPFEETPDQLHAIEAVKADMERIQPMDRLICGDVGYGKTEVAVRAAFKAVMDGKQVAVLAPTTILCEQHLHTFANRYKDFPIELDMLSRFRTSQQQKAILAKMASGELDVVVGTHRIIGKDVKWKDLGLVIVDEEQRFGVEHKEKLKALRTQVDVLTMSATPIPRTLHMSLVEMRDMSIIATPPNNRLPIETYSMEFDEDMIKFAVERELERGGQVYIVYNRVQDIKGFAQNLTRIVPKARYVIGHGQMDEAELDEVMHDFIEHRADVLISTTIIENGVDIPNANTIIIDRADRLGLAQLYQLRGRVGRSDRQAYCYLFYHPDSALNEEAQRRLAALHEHSNIGGGFKIAMRDLEIRGAGNILGPEQSGDIAAVGFELYAQMLADEVQRLRHEDQLPEVDSRVDVPVDSYIPDDYIETTRLKVEVYKKISSCRHPDDVLALRDELQDRYGEPPEPVEDMLLAATIRSWARWSGIESLALKESVVEIKPGPNNRLDPAKLPRAMDQYKKRFIMTHSQGGLIQFKLKKEGLEPAAREIAELIGLLILDDQAAATAA